MPDTYAHTRDRLETYFDRTAAETWERLTSEAPVSRSAQTVREGRDRMRALMLDRLPADLDGARVLDAGCGAGPDVDRGCAARGAQVIAVDISPRLLDVAPRPHARRRSRARIDFLRRRHARPGLGRFDFVVAMDSLIHYRTADIAARAGRARRAHRRRGRLHRGAARRRCSRPCTSPASSSRAATARPPSCPRIAGALARALAPACGRRLETLGRVASGFYISQAMELRP